MCVCVCACRYLSLLFLFRLGGEGFGSLALLLAFLLLEVVYSHDVLPQPRKDILHDIIVVDLHCK